MGRMMATQTTTETLQMACVLLEYKGAGFRQLNLDAKIMARRTPHITQFQFDSVV